MWFAYGSESVPIMKPVLTHSRASYKLLTAHTWPSYDPCIAPVCNSDFLGQKTIDMRVCHFKFERTNTQKSKYSSKHCRLCLKSQIFRQTLFC